MKRTNLLKSVAAMTLGMMAGCQEFRGQQSASVAPESHAIPARYIVPPVTPPSDKAAEDLNQQVIAVSQPATDTKVWLTVNSDSFKHYGQMPPRLTAYGAGHSPDLTWSNVPEGTKSFAIIVEDPDEVSLQRGPFVHWVIYNIPGNQKSIDDSIAAEPTLYDLNDAMQGKNSMGTIGYVGPMHPNAGVHHYYFQVFALDKMLDLQPGIDKQQLLNAMDGHVLAKGLIVGTVPQQ